MKKSNTITSRDGKETISAAEFDRRFEAGENITGFMVLDRAQRPGRSVQRVKVDFPKPFLNEINAEAERIGVPRQAWIKRALARALKQQKSER